MIRKFKNIGIVAEKGHQDGHDRHNFVYVLNVSKKFYRVILQDAWGTEDEMHATKFGIYAASVPFKKSASVQVYVLCEDGYYRNCSSMQAVPGDEALLPFKKEGLKYGGGRPDCMGIDEYYYRTCI